MVGGSFIFDRPEVAKLRGQMWMCTTRKNELLKGIHMTREFLDGLKLDKDTIDKILDENSRDIGKWKQKAEQADTDKATVEKQLIERNKDFDALQKSTGDIDSLKNQLEELQKKYDTDIAEYKTQIDNRTYIDAVKAAVEKSGLKFTSKSAEKVFMDTITANKLKVKDGALDGFDDYLEKAKKEDPSAFAEQQKQTIKVDTQGSLAGGKAVDAPTSLAAALRERYDMKG